MTGVSSAASGSSDEDAHERPLCASQRCKTSSCQLSIHVTTQHAILLQAGNLAHLLNHSCQPNCHSRLITVWDAAAQAPREHVMLFARVCMHEAVPAQAALNNSTEHHRGQRTMLLVWWLSSAHELDTPPSCCHSAGRHSCECRADVRLPLRWRGQTAVQLRRCGLPWFRKRATKPGWWRRATAAAIGGAAAAQAVGPVARRWQHLRC